jgi:hypothetical protein
VYQYLSGNQFKERVVSIFEAFQMMREDLDKERTAIQKLWAKREKQIERVLTSTTLLHGELAGIIGNDLPAISAMELSGIGTQLEENT